MRFGNNGVVVENGSNVVAFPQRKEEKNMNAEPIVVEPTRHSNVPDMVISKDSNDLRFATDKVLVEEPVYNGNVSDFFSNRKAIWEGQGERIDGCMSVEEVFNRVPLLASPINKEPIYDQNGAEIPGFYATIREQDRRSMGIVKGKYHVLQNTDAFSLLDDLVGEGVRLQSIGTWNGDSRTWILGRTPNDYKIDGDDVAPYILLLNSFDGSGSLKIAMVVNRVACQNMISLTLKNAQRTWSARHTATITGKLDQARETLGLADEYMKHLQTAYNDLLMIKMDENKVVDFCKKLSPEIEGGSETKNRNAKQLREDIQRIWRNAPDLKDRDQTAARFIQAVADAEDHRTPARRTKNFVSNRFENLATGGHSLLDRAYNMVLSA